MLICKKCGADNPLGRVFCGSCGTKLDLDRVSSQAVGEMSRPNWFLRSWRLLVGLVVAALLGVAGLAFWPQTERIGKEPAVGGAQRVLSALRPMLNLRPGQAIGRDFSEEDLNALLAERAEALKLQMVAVRVGEGYFVMRAVRKAEGIGLGDYKLQPALSYDLTCVPRGSVVHVTRVVMGRLPLPGAFRSGAVRRFHALMATQKEWSLFQYTTEITAGNGKLGVKLAR